LASLMDKVTAAVVVVGVFGLIIIAFVFRFRNKGKAQIKGPFGTGLKVEGENAPGPAAVRKHQVEENEGMICDFPCLAKPVPLEAIIEAIEKHARAGA
jgi:type IV secretory pathway TrbL component